MGFPSGLRGCWDSRVFTARLKSQPIFQSFHSRLRRQPALLSFQWPKGRLLLLNSSCAWKGGYCSRGPWGNHFRASPEPERGGYHSWALSIMNKVTAPVAKVDVNEPEYPTEREKPCSNKFMPKYLPESEPRTEPMHIQYQCLSLLVLRLLICSPSQEVFSSRSGSYHSSTRSSFSHSALCPSYPWTLHQHPAWHQSLLCLLIPTWTSISQPTFPLSSSS